MTTRKPLFISALGLCSLAMVLLLSLPRKIQEEVVREEVEEEWWEDEPPTVREVLMALYESTDGENWVVNAGWGSGDPCSGQWYDSFGPLECDFDGNLVALTLVHNNLNGGLPSNFWGLFNGTEIVLQGNPGLSGPLPDIRDSRGRFPMGLKSIDLRENDFRGSVPSSWSLLPLLEEVNLAGNELTGSFPSVFSSMPLKVLNLAKNGFSGSVPSWIGSLTDLEFLRLDQNSFSGALPNVNDLEQLTYLDLSHNSWTGSMYSSPVPESIMVLQVSHSSLTGAFPSWLLNSLFLQDTRLLALDRTPFQCPLPAGPLDPIVYKSGAQCACAPGSYSEDVNSPCVQCPENTYQPVTSPSFVGEHPCEPCGPGYHSEPGSTECEEDTVVKRGFEALWSYIGWSIVICAVGAIWLKRKRDFEARDRWYENVDDYDDYNQ